MNRNTLIKILRITVGVFAAIMIGFIAFYFAQFKYEIFNLNGRTATGLKDTPIIDAKDVQNVIQKRLLPNDSINSYFVEQYVNDARAQNDLTQLRHNGELAKSSKAKLEDMIALNYFAHTSPSSKQPWNFISEAGYNYQKAGENLANGQFTNEKQIVEDWLNSPEHRAVMLNPNFCDIGVSIAKAKTFLDNTNTFIVVMHVGYRTDSPIDACD